jgi:hypothetical protein
MTIRRTTRRSGSQRKNWLDRCDPRDFDGHTDFGRLTPDQRLDWLHETAVVIRDFKGRGGQHAFRLEHPARRR